MSGLEIVLSVLFGVAVLACAYFANEAREWKDEAFYASDGWHAAIRRWQADVERLVARDPEQKP